MDEVNPRNERIKAAWIEELTVKYADSTVDQKLAAMAHYDAATACRDYTKFCREDVNQFIAETKARHVASVTKVATARHVKSFFEWMVMDERLKPKAARKAIEALRLPLKAARAGQARRSTKPPTLEQIKSTLAGMPKTTAIERRNRALIAFTLLSGARDGAIVSMNVGHVDLAGKEVLQHPDEVATKASKHIHTWFFPVGDVFENEVADYIRFLKTELGFGDGDPLFPATRVGQDENDRFVPVGLSKAHWAGAQPVRDIFRAAFTGAGHRYFNPHSFRKTLMATAYDRALPPAQLKAWSQNLGHENLDTSVNSYGNLSPDNQRREMMALHENVERANDPSSPVTRSDLERLEGLIMKMTPSSD